MKRLTLTIPDDFYETFVSFIKHIPEVSIFESVTNKNRTAEDILDEIPEWQQKKVSEIPKDTENQYYESLKKD